MTSGLQTWYRIWSMAVFGQQRALVVGMSWVILVLTVLGAGFGALVAKGNRIDGACGGGGFMLLMLANTWWSYFMSGAAVQNSPANGKLVPRLNWQVRQVAALAWVGTVLMAMPFAYANSLSHAELLLLVVGFSGLGFYLAGREVDVLVVLLALFVYLMMKNAPHVQEWMSGTLVLLAGACLVLAYVAYSLRAAFPNGGERHWKQIDQQRAALSWQDLKSWEENGRRGGKRNLVYSWMLKRKCQGSSRASDLMLDGLGARNNAMVTLVPLAALVGIALLARLALEVLGLPVDFLSAGSAGGFVAGPMVGAAVAWTRFSAAIRNTSTEQALLRLCPGMPAANRITAELAKRLAGICLFEWLAWLAGTLIIIAAWGAQHFMLQGAIAVSAAMLMLTALPLENYAGKAQGLDVGLVMLCVVMAILLIVAFIVRDDFKFWLFMVGVMLAISSAYFAHRWFSMVRGPIAFPSGRMA